MKFFVLIKSRSFGGSLSVFGLDALCSVVDCVADLIGDDPSSEITIICLNDRTRRVIRPASEK